MLPPFSHSNVSLRRQSPPEIVDCISEMHVVERFAYDHDAGTLTRSWVVEDCEYFIGSLADEDTVEVADIPFEPHNCSDLTNEHVAESA